MSKWRVLTAYLRPSPSQDSEYILQRDHRISECVHVCAQAFEPWRDLKYTNKEQIQSLSAIFKSASELGITLFAQPTDVQFRWPDKSEVGPNRVAVAPALVKKTDEGGRALDRVQVMFEAILKRLK